MFGLRNAELINSEFMIHFMNNIVFFIIATIASTPALKWLYGRVKSSVSDNRLLQYQIIGTIDVAIVAVVIWISTAFLVGESYNPFLYFRF